MQSENTYGYSKAVIFFSRIFHSGIHMNCFMSDYSYIIAYFVSAVNGMRNMNEIHYVGA